MWTDDRWQKRIIRSKLSCDWPPQSQDWKLLSKINLSINTSAAYLLNKNFMNFCFDPCFKSAKRNWQLNKGFFVICLFAIKRCAMFEVWTDALFITFENEERSDSFRIQKEDRTACLTLGGTVDVGTHFKVIQLSSSQFQWFADCVRKDQRNGGSKMQQWRWGTIFPSRSKHSILSKWPL